VFGGERVESGGEPQAGGDFRLMLAGEPDAVSPVLAQAAATLAEALGLAAAGVCISWIADASFGATCGLCAFLYYPFASAFLGCTPAIWFIKREAASESALLGNRRAASSSDERRERLYLVKSGMEPERPSAQDKSPGLDSDALRRRTVAG